MKADGWDWQLNMFPNRDYEDDVFAIDFVEEVCWPAHSTYEDGMACNDWMVELYMDFVEEWSEKVNWPCQHGYFENSAGVLDGKFCFNYE